jgi:hypothetical protein
MNHYSAVIQLLSPLFTIGIDVLRVSTQPVSCLLTVVFLASQRQCSRFRFMFTCFLGSLVVVSSGICLGAGMGD